MMLQRGQCLASPVFQLRIITALRVAFEQRNRILMRANLHRIVFRGEVFRLGVTQFIEFFLRSVIETGGDLRKPP